jgi:mannose-1-phosphate guanylyltransferase
MAEYNRQVWGIILAGGEGKRLQSFIRSRYGTDAPKQYCAFTGSRSMLRHTIDRAEMLVPPERLLTIVNKHHVRYIQDQLADRPAGTVIVQPLKRETGPGILYPLLHVYQRDPEAIVCLFPSDHFVLNEENFMKHIEFSTEFVAENPQSILLLGVSPQQLEGEYGWIVTGEQVFDQNTARVNTISRFVEKPDPSTAYQLYHKGGLLNTMVMVSKAKALLASFKALTPAVYNAFWGIREVLGSSLEGPSVKKLYSKLSPMNFSYSILEKNPVGLRTVRVQGGYWNDWGNAARIQSDIQSFCVGKRSLSASLPLVNAPNAAVYSAKQHECV